MVRLSRPICPSGACAEALPIVLVLMAAIRMAATISITNFAHSVGMTASTHALYPNGVPAAHAAGARATKPLNRRSRSCWFGHIPGLLDSKGPLRPERLQAWQWRKLRPGQT